MTKITFWVSGFLVFYAYMGYPLVLWILCRFSDRRESPDTVTSKPAGGIAVPKVTMLISAYNEESVIDGKIRNSLSLCYPSDSLQIIVVSDGSTDRTNEITSWYKDQGVLLANYPGRIGKTACLNRVIPEAKGDIIVFSDANSKYNKDAIQQMIAIFADPEIGFVTGYTRYRTEEDGEDNGSIGIYSRLEKITKALESRIGSCVGADGAIFAIRKRLYRSLNPSDINDLVIPFHVVRQGYRGVLSQGAYCVESTAGGLKGEFHRQVRITNRTLRALYNNRDLANPLKTGFFAFELVSHKILKYLVPFFLILLIACGGVIAFQDRAYSVFLLAIMVITALSVISNWGGLRLGKHRLLSMTYEFLYVNCAILKGWWKFLNSETQTTWAPTKR